MALVYESSEFSARLIQRWVKSGSGVDTFHDRLYFGEFVDGKKEGHGVWISKNFAFVGTFRQN